MTFLEIHAMPKYSIVFIAPVDEKKLRHRIIESEDQDTALKKFFTEEISEYYTNDEQGFFYFKQDFNDSDDPSGSVITLE